MNTRLNAVAALLLLSGLDPQAGLLVERLLAQPRQCGLGVGLSPLADDVHDRILSYGGIADGRRHRGTFLRSMPGDHDRRGRAQMIRCRAGGLGADPRIEGIMFGERPDPHRLIERF